MLWNKSPKQAFLAIVCVCGCTLKGHVMSMCCNVKFLALCTDRSQVALSNGHLSLLATCASKKQELTNKDHTHDQVKQRMKHRVPPGPLPTAVASTAKPPAQEGQRMTHQ